MNQVNHLLTGRYFHGNKTRHNAGKREEQSHRTGGIPYSPRPPLRRLIERGPCLDKREPLAQSGSSRVLNMTEVALREPAGMVASGSLESFGPTAFFRTRRRSGIFTIYTSYT